MRVKAENRMVTLFLNSLGVQTWAFSSLFGAIWVPLFHFYLDLSPKPLQRYDILSDISLIHYHLWIHFACRTAKVQITHAAKERGKGNLLFWRECSLSLALFVPAKISPLRKNKACAIGSQIKNSCLS